MRSPTQSELDRAWEDICDGCGKCCSIGKNVACPSLDVETNRCTQYTRRKTTEMCLKVEPSNVMSLHARGVLPPSCAYVRYMNEEPPLPRPVAGAKLIPFQLAHPNLGQRYLLERKKWLTKSSAEAVPSAD